MTKIQKIIKYAAIALAIFLSVCIIGGIGSALLSASRFFGGAPAAEMTQYNITDSVKSLKIDISAAELEIKNGDSFTLETNRKYVRHKETNEFFKIYEVKPFLAAHPGGIKIILTIPQNTKLEYMDIEAGAGTVTIDTLSTNTLKLDMGAGEFIANRIETYTEAEIDSGASSFTVNGGFMHNADIDIGVGEMNLTSRLTGTNEIDYGIGEANLVLIGSSEDYKIKLDKGAGKATLNGNTMRNDSVYGGGSSYIGINGGVGELNITFKHDMENLL